MPSLIVPRSGLPLDFGLKPGAAEGMIALTLTDDAIENMIKCIRDGDGIQLSYGAESTISDGTNTLRFTTSQDNFTYDIYQNTVASSNSPNTPEISKGPRKNNNCKLQYMGSTAAFLTPKTARSTKAKESVPMSKQVSQRSQLKSKNATEGMDNALETLQNNLATENARKAANTAQRASSQLLPAGAKRGQAARDRLGARNTPGGAAAKRAMAGRNIGSIPTSPALNASSPALAPTSVPASEQAAEKTKTIRAPIIHRLAVEPATESELFKYKTSNATKEEFRAAIYKVADLKDGKYTLNPKFYKELDVWNFGYKDSKERQAAINNAVRAFDKMRMSGSDSEWQLLYPVDERNRGNTLSKLQAKIALNGPMAPAKKPAADSVHGSEDEDEDLFGDGSQKTAPRSSNGTKTKAQKDREAQDKRLSGKATAKQKSTTARSAPAPKDKTAPKSSGAKKATASSSAPKSSEFVNDSDEEDDHEPEPSKRPSPKPASKKESAPVVKPSTKRKSDNDDIGNSPPKKARSAATSSSLSSQSGKSTSQEKEKEKPRHPLSQPRTTVASAQRSINNARSKNITSPKKSSPLASSPPVSASDLEESDKSTSVSPAAPIKRKNVMADREDANKRCKGLISETEADSDKFAILYDKYTTLWHELDKKDQRDDREMEQLKGMEEKLAKLKQKIIEDAKNA